MFPRKRVFFLGAGASRAASQSRKWKAPLVDEFFSTDYRNILAGSRRRFEWPRLERFLKRYFNFDPATNDRVSIEEVLSFLELASSHLGQVRTGEQDLPIVRSEFQRYIVDLMTVISNNVDNEVVDTNQDFYRRLALLLEKNDTIITLNWDTLLETALVASSSYGKELMHDQINLIRPVLPAGNWDVSQPVATDFMKLADKGYFLKLHGSINLAVCSNEQCARRNWPVRFGLNEYWGVGWPCDSCGDTLEALIVPPQFDKAYHRNRLTKLQFNIANQQLEFAETIVIVGCSFSDYDFGIRALLRSTRQVEKLGLKALKRTIIIVDPNATDVLQRVRSLVGHALPTFDTTYQTFLSTSEFIRGYSP